LALQLKRLVVQQSAMLVRRVYKEEFQVLAASELRLWSARPQGSKAPPSQQLVRLSLHWS